MSIAKLVQCAYRYAMYGKQIGKVAKNGGTAYKRGNIITALDANGKVTRTIEKMMAPGNGTRTVTTTFLDNGAKKVTNIYHSEGLNENLEKTVNINWFSKWFNEYGTELHPSGKAWNGQIHKEGNHIRGTIDRYDLNPSYNCRREIDKYI